MPTLTVHRDATPWVDRARAYILKVDGEARGTVKHGETLTVDVSPGVHRMKMAIDWCGSPEIEVDTAGDVALRCWAAATPMTAAFFAVFLRHRYIGISHEVAGASP